MHMHTFGWTPRSNNYPPDACRVQVTFYQAIGVTQPADCQINILQLFAHGGCLDACCREQLSPLDMPIIGYRFCKAKCYCQRQYVGIAHEGNVRARIVFSQCFEHREGEEGVADGSGPDNENIHGHSFPRQR